MSKVILDDRCQPGPFLDDDLNNRRQPRPLLDNDLHNRRQPRSLLNRDHGIQSARIGGTTDQRALYSRAFQGLAQLESWILAGTNDHIVDLETARFSVLVGDVKTQVIDAVIAHLLQHRDLPVL